MPNSRKCSAIAGITLIAVLVCGFGCDSARETPRTRPAAGPVAPGTNLEPRLRLRLPAVAGFFYPGDKAGLSQTLDGLLERAPAHDIPRLKGFVSPHAGYAYSGPIAASAYKALAGRDVRTVIILASSHHAAFQGASIPNVDAYQTPLGIVPISEKAQKLVKVEPFVLEPRCPIPRPGWWQLTSKPPPPAGEETPDTWEHSVEVQVPFLQKTLRDFKILPVVFGDADPEKVAQVLGEIIDDKTVVIASSDLSHYHSYDVARELDNRCVRAICNLDMDEMKHQEACGQLPILTLMHLARQKGWKPQLLDCRNSGDITSEKDRVVGYAAVAFHEPAPASVASADRKFLLDLARRTLVRVATDPESPELEVKADAVSPRLAQTQACFVTLTQNGSLRGCIGHILPQEPLYQAVMHNARNAAARDPRFPPVKSDEVDKLKIEISVLTEPQPLPFSSPEDLLNKLRPFEDGVLLRIGAHGATFLPQVWAQIPDKVEFLSQLSRKAGCEPSAWRGNETSVSIYHVEAFDESEL
jgi:AmmeMemoRadiSam system protein A